MLLMGEQRVELARQRMELRAIDVEVAAIRQESRRYRQMNFGLDIKDIQLTALLDQRGACAARISTLEKELHLRPQKHYHPFSWLLVPIALWLHLNKAISSPAAEPSVSASNNRPSFATERVAVAAGR